ncbi:hypothetical protein SRABI128_05584 [Microbacterium sp. Bi128]|nr:hypothetical protein SRABI128_05584 [Microbacterium sp. Bi128]
MNAIGDERGGPDPPSHADPVDRDQFVAGKAHEAGGEHPAQVLDGLGFEEAPDGFDGGHHGGERDHRHNEQPCEVLGAAETVGVRPGRAAASEQKGDPQRNGGQGIGKIVDRVRQQRHGATDEDDDQLEQRRGPQSEQGDLDGANALGTCLQDGVDRVGRVMGVGHEELLQPPLETGRVDMAVRAVVVVIAVVVGMSVRVRVDIVAGVRGPVHAPASLVGLCGAVL